MVNASETVARSEMVGEALRWRTTGSLDVDGSCSRSSVRYGIMEQQEARQPLSTVSIEHGISMLPTLVGQEDDDCASDRGVSEGRIVCWKDDTD